MPGAIAIQRASRLAGIPSDRLFRKWLNAALPKPAELSLRIVNAAEGRNLNSAFRGKDYATNVLTFVYHEPKSPVLLGDIVLCAQVVAREAREQEKTLEAHYAHMTVHGALHLAGMDHEKEREAKVMESREIAILRALGYENPYDDHVGGH
jgi:probable rRNA maturation factor